MYIDRENHSLGFFDIDWNYLSVTNKGTYDELNSIPSRPEPLSQMIRYAQILAKPFPFVRVDFYWVEDHMYFGELTFVPGGGMDVIQCKVQGAEFGELLELD